jgi:hypothetical protein
MLKLVSLSGAHGTAWLLEGFQFLLFSSIRLWHEAPRFAVVQVLTIEFLDAR